MYILKSSGQKINSLICGLNNIIVAKYSTTRKLPNEVDMAKEISNNMENFKYDLVSGDWFEYKITVGRWYRLNRYQIDSKIFNLLMKHESLKSVLTVDYKNRVKASLEMINGVDFDEYRNKNKELKLVPFKNGILDMNTITLLEHNKEYYFTHGLNINFNSSAVMENHMINFLCSISNNNINTLKVLRSFIQCVLLRDNQYQVALYLHGPGGTGKSTFEKLLISLVGNTNSAVLNIIDLNRQFTMSKLMDKSLVLFSDVQGYTGDPSKLRLLISGDVINAERKFKDSFDLQPDALVVLSSNLLWSPKDASTGLQRRIIYIPVITVPDKIDRKLFLYNLTDNTYSGTLSTSLSGLVNWALSNTDSNLNLLNNAVETNKLINPNAIRDTNPLVDWIKSYISYEYGNNVSIGRKTSNPKTHLYPNYLLFCKEYGYIPLPFQSFSSVLMQQMNLLVSNDINKKRVSNGYVIVNIKLNDNFISEDNQNTIVYNILEEFN
jgi:putative DNA primase/helicase